MDKINSQTRSGVLLESLYYLDKYENERIVLYKSLVTANRIKIDFDFSAKSIYISAILPIDSVDPTKVITDPDRVIFPDWNEEVDAVEATKYVLVPGYTISIEIEEVDDGEGSRTITITTVSALASYAPIDVPELVYSAALTLQQVDNVRASPRKNIQITFDEPNLKAIIEAVLPFESYLNANAEIVVVPLDD